MNNIDICGPSTYYKISTDVSHLDALENKRQLSDLLANFRIYQIFGPKISAELTEVETFRNKFHFYFSPKAKSFFLRNGIMNEYPIPSGMLNWIIFVIILL